jgi:hypothetical protein
MNPTSRENWAALALLDLLLTAMGCVFVARAFLRHVAAAIKRSHSPALRRHHEN